MRVCTESLLNTSGYLGGNYKKYTFYKVVESFCLFIYLLTYKTCQNSLEHSCFFFLFYILYFNLADTQLSIVMEEKNVKISQRSG